MPPTHPITQYWDLVAAGLSALGVDLSNTLLLADMMRDAGFVNVETRIFHVPIGVWPKNKVLKMAGLYFRTILLDGLSPIALGPILGAWDGKRSRLMLGLLQLGRRIVDGSLHSHMPLYVICGQKPDLGVSTSWS